MGALHDLVKAGKVRYLGASSMWTHQFAALQHAAEKHGYTKFVAMQNHYNLIYREEEREMNRYCNQTGVGLIPVSLPSSILVLADAFQVGPFGRRTTCTRARSKWTHHTIDCQQEWSLLFQRQLQLRGDRTTRP